MVFLELAKISVQWTWYFYSVINWPKTISLRFSNSLTHRPWESTICRVKVLFQPKSESHNVASTPWGTLLSREVHWLRLPCVDMLELLLCFICRLPCSLKVRLLRGAPKLKVVALSFGLDHPHPGLLPLSVSCRVPSGTHGSDGQLWTQGCV